MENNETLYNIFQNNFDNLKYVISLLMENKKINMESLNFQNEYKPFNKRKNNLINLVYLGYLGYDSSKNKIFIPNKEIHEIFKELIKSKKWQILNNKKSIVINPGEDNYSEFSKTKYFIDKTKLILTTNDIMHSCSSFNNICVTRPKRFGKTLTVDMLVAYYSFSESKISVFDDKKIS